MASTYQITPTIERLRPGPRGLPRRQVVEIQRGRLIAAAVDTVSDVGYARMTVAHVIGRARVSRKTFYDLFDDREDCFLAAFDYAVERARQRAIAAHGLERGWREGMRAALGGLLAFIDEEPALARLSIVEALGAGERVLERRSAVLAELTEAVDRGRLDARAISDPPLVTAEGVVGGVLAVLHARLLEGSKGSFTQLQGSLMSMIMLPYLGARAASLERARHPPEPVRRGRRRHRRRADVLEGLEMRLTYRTVRVLIVIRERPGASNREIAAAAGVSDQGQISKLLNRLGRLGLVENIGRGQEMGAANAWRLTAKGVEVERATRPH